MKKVAVIPFYKAQMNNVFFNDDGARDGLNVPYKFLREEMKNRSYVVNTVDITPIKDVDYIIFYDLDLKYLFQVLLSRGGLSNCIYLQYEPPVIIKEHSTKNMRRISGFFGKVLTWNDDLIDNRKFFKFYFPIPFRVDFNDKFAFSHKKLLVNISSDKHFRHKDELYTKRRQAIRYFERKIPKQFDLFGVGWSKDEFSSYKGTCESKNETLKNYKFSICYENMTHMNGGITEKIFDCFYAGCVPIYWGADNISDYIPEDCFIDKRRFATYDELYNFISNMKEAEHEGYIAAIEKYLNSENFKKFLPEYYASTVIKALESCNEKELLGLEQIKAFMWIITLKFYYKVYVWLENKTRSLYKKLFRRRRK